METTRKRTMASEVMEDISQKRDRSANSSVSEEEDDSFESMDKVILDDDLDIFIEEAEPDPHLFTPARQGNYTGLWATRIYRDYQEFKKLGSHWGISAQILGDDFGLWAVQILGPKDTPYEGGCFQGTLRFSNLFPYSPPIFSFISNVFHPNVSEDGTVCLEELYKNWSPCYTVWSLLVSVQFLLLDANVDEPLNPVASLYYATNRKAFDDIVKQCVKASWEDLKKEDNSFANLVDEKGEMFLQLDEFSDYFQETCSEAEKCNAFMDIPNWKDRLRYRMFNSF